MGVGLSPAWFPHFPRRVRLVSTRSVSLPVLRPSLLFQLLPPQVVSALRTSRKLSLFRCSSMMSHFPCICSPCARGLASEAEMPSHAEPDYSGTAKIAPDLAAVHHAVSMGGSRREACVSLARSEMQRLGRDRGRPVRPALGFAQSLRRASSPPPILSFLQEDRQALQASSDSPSVLYCRNRACQIVPVRRRQSCGPG